MDNDKPLLKKTIKDYLNDWTDGLKEKGLKGVWPSWLQGQYINPKNIKAQDRVRRKATHKKTTFFMRINWHGKFRKIELPKKKYEGENLTTIQKIVNREIDRRIRWKEYYSEGNALNAIAQMLIRGGSRAMRRTLARKLNICKYGKWLNTYKEAETMVMEQDNFPSDGIKRNFGVK
jgi:hypothetical protein